MAVSFKVPKSPKREIVASDAFLGVDLTNTGVSMDGTRSPYAPNMIRHVPGKVRKRMGYYKEILFGTKTNVNFADGTSAKAQEMIIYPEDEWVKLYDLIQTIKSDSSYTLYVEFDYASDEDFYIVNDSTLVEAAQPDEEGNYPHFSGSISCASTDEFTEVDVKTLSENEIYIKNFALMLEKDSSYAWSPAPKYFVERETNDPVYGCHFLKNGTDGYDGDRVVNVNRAYKTSDEWQVIDFSETLFWRYTLGEIPCTEQIVYVDFDYVYEDASPTQKILFSISGAEFTLDNTGGETEHFSFAGKLRGRGSDTISFVEREGASTILFKIKNLSLVYEKDGNYAWSPAPEDNKEKFHLKDMYNIEPKDYALSDSFTKVTPSFSGERSESFEFCDDESHGGSYQYISFDITTSISNSSATLFYTFFRMYDNVSDSDLSSMLFTYNAFSDEGDRNPNFTKKHVDWFGYVPSGRYAKTLKVVWRLTDGSSTASVTITNFHVKNYSIRDTFVVSSAWYLYHVGKDFYLKAHDKDTIQKVYEDANEHISQAFQINDNSYIIDGKEIYEFTIKDGENVRVIDQDVAYIPTVTKAREYNGGGVTVDAFNLLQPGFIEQFIGVATQRTYQLSQDDLDDTPVKVWLLDNNGNWNPKEEDTDFSVDRQTGKVTFVTAPGVTPIQGEDSIRIQAYKTFEGYRERITKCTFGTLYGVSGAADRVFLSGNPEHPNWDFYSQYKDATYFPDIGYSTLGSAQSAITGYAIVSNYLATFKDGFDQSQSVFVREGDMLVVDEEQKTSEPVFKLINSLQGVGAVSPYAFGYLQTEPVFLTEAGIYAITMQDITGERYTQNRSFYLDGQLRKEPNQKTAIATIYNDQYILALNGNLYVLDGLQATRTDKSEPYATRQYAGFYCTDVPVLTLWTDNALCFGTADGKVCRFYTDDTDAKSYNDDGKPIYACWDTPDLDGSLFYKNKTFRYLAVRLMKTIRTTAKIYSRKLGVWNFIMEKTVINNPIDFENLDFENFTFSVDETEQVLHTKIRVKKVDKARFRIENDKLDEPFGINDLALEYIESGNYKG